jgi:hypothetical protein
MIFRGQGPARTPAIWLVFGLLAALGCGDSLGPDHPGPDPVEPEPDAPVQTSALLYTMERGPLDLSAVIGLTYTNKTSANVYFDNCNIWLGTHDGSQAFRRVCIGQTTPTRIDPGGVLQTTLRIRQPFEANSFPRFEVDPVSGLYRVFMQLYARTEFDAGFEVVRDPLPVAAGRSNVFRLEFPSP